MTKKLNCMFVIFMAVFMFSCAVEDTIDVKPKVESVLVGEGFDDVFAKQRTKIAVANWKNAKTPTVAEIDNSFLVTKLSGSGYISLFIKPLAPAPNKANLSLGPNADLTFANDAAILQTAMDNSVKDGYFDPRKILTEKGGPIRIAWSGLVGDIPGEGQSVPILPYRGYDSKYKSVAGVSSKGYGLIDDWVVNQYLTSNPRVGTPVQTIDKYMRNTTGVGTRAWAWFLDGYVDDHGSVDEHYSFVAPNNTLLFGFDAVQRTGNQPLVGNGIYKRGLNKNTAAATGSYANNNLNPPGKMVFARKFGGRGGPNWVKNSAVFLSTVVGYNIKIKDMSADDIKLMYPDGVDSKIGKIYDFYMEFDAGSKDDAEADGYTSALNFPHWGNDLIANDGLSVDGTAGKNVQKFTGILLMRK